MNPGNPAIRLDPSLIERCALIAQSEFICLFLGDKTNCTDCHADSEPGFLSAHLLCKSVFNWMRGLDRVVKRTGEWCTARQCAFSGAVFPLCKGRRWPQVRSNGLIVTMAFVYIQSTAVSVGDLY